MSSTSNDETKYLYRQGSITSLPDEDDQMTAASDSSIIQQRQLSSNGSSKVPNLDDRHSSHIEKEYQTSTIDLQTVSDEDNPDTTVEHSFQSWKELVDEISSGDYRYKSPSQSDSTDDVTTSFGFQLHEQTPNNYRLNQTASEEISHDTDYETLLRSKQLYYDPNPEVIRKPQMITPIIYKQNIKIKFLRPPSVPLGPLIIREVRPPQPPPPPPLVIRQRPPPPLSPPPIILREKPPRAPVIMTTQVLTRTLPPIPPPPRSVIIEKLPPLPPKPRDVIIERWIPYESAHKRKVIVQRAEEAKAYPPPKNIIITYDKVEAQIVRQFERLGVKSEDPENYTVCYGNSLLDTEQLLAQARELGITEDISPPRLIGNELQEQLSSNIDEPNFLIGENKQYSNGNVSDSRTAEEAAYSEMYVPTYDNLINGSSLSMNYDGLNNEEDLSAQLAQYGITTESIPF